MRILVTGSSGHLGEPLVRRLRGSSDEAVGLEDLCELFHRQHGLRCLVLRTSRFFPEADDSPAIRQAYDDANVKVNEFLHRRVDLEDVVDAHVLAVKEAPWIGFGRYIRG